MLSSKNKARVLSVLAIVVMLFSFANFSPAAAAPNTWTPAGSMTDPRTGVQAIQIHRDGTIGRDA